MSERDKPAFPEVFTDRPGMTLRDYFAAHAMPACIWHEPDPETAAADAYEYADAMLAARSKP